MKRLIVILCLTLIVFAVTSRASAQCYSNGAYFLSAGGETLAYESGCNTLEIAHKGEVVILEWTEVVFINPQVSPTGRYVGYTEFVPGDNIYWVYDTLTRANWVFYEGQVRGWSWTSDERILVAVTDYETDQSQIVIITMEGEIEQLYEGEGSFSFPVLNNQGQLAFYANTVLDGSTSTTDVMLLNAAGEMTMLLSSINWNPGGLSWSADGNTLAVDVSDLHESHISRDDHIETLFIDNNLNLHSVPVRHVRWNPSRPNIFLALTDDHELVVGSVQQLGHTGIIGVESLTWSDEEEFFFGVGNYATANIAAGLYEGSLEELPVNPRT